LQNEHKNDFYNKVDKKLNPTIGPRQPWHDIHQKLEGKITKDILDNFVKRWEQQATQMKDKLLPLRDEEFNFSWKVRNHRNAQDGDSNTWNVQFFRSINHDSVYLDFQKFHGGVGYENSIHDAYVHHIRRSKHFIYIENQYFLGSSFYWKESPSRQSPNLIPLELTTRIIEAISREEDFRIYVVIPMYSEGDPNSSAVQEILLWQKRTMQMMYNKISKAINKSQSDAHPTDYLSFYCLGKREKMIENNDHSIRPGSPKSKKKSQVNRFMIYVHSKMAIFDDEYIIVGSANINERSMNGNRDTEMATGAYQPMNGNPNKADDRGDVSKFRMAVWAEHCGVHLPEHYFPSSLKCMNIMNNIGAKNLQRYLKGNNTQSESHLMKYPINIKMDGNIDFLDGMKRFPDTGGYIFGSDSVLPDSLTA